jgi:L-histidine Nalpha-methyltransferase
VTGDALNPRVTFTDLLPADFDATTLRDDVRRGLGTGRKALPPRWFYDKIGSELFEEITRLPEYYPTRTEREILARHAADAVQAADPDILVELGSGSAAKITLLLDALVAHRAARGAIPGEVPRAAPRYVALDVSEDALRGAAATLVRRYDTMEIDLLRADFSHQLDRLPPGRGRMVVFLGSTIGNFAPEPRARFLAHLRAALAPGEHLLLGSDLVKPAGILVPAYDDAAGVTAAFNLNLLEVLNGRLGADFDRAGFDHHALWNPDQEWIEMRLRARQATRVTVLDLDLVVELDPGEEILTEISAKFRPGPLAAELRAAGFDRAGWWTDERQWFALSLWRAC